MTLTIGCSRDLVSPTGGTVRVTGGAGFIGSTVVNLDKLTYAGTPDSVAEVVDDPCYTFERGDLYDGLMLRNVFVRHRPDARLHLPAETHVDRSIDAPADFIRTPRGYLHPAGRGAARRRGCRFAGRRTTSHGRGAACCAACAFSASFYE